MKNQPLEEKLSAEKPDAWWYKVYLTVMLTTVFIISALWMFSRYFSK